MKKELATAINDNTRHSQLNVDIRAEVVDLPRRLGARDGVIWYITKDSCVSLGPSLWGLVNSFRAGLNKSVAEAFRADSIRSQFHADDAIDGITLGFSKGVVSNDGNYSTEREVVVDPPIDLEFVEM